MPLISVAEKRAVAPYTHALCSFVECNTSPSSTVRLEPDLLGLASAECCDDSSPSADCRCSDLSRQSTIEDSSEATFGLAATGLARSLRLNLPGK